MLLKATMTKNVEKKHIVPIIVGPTAIGKTSLSLEYAQHHDCEIISADSRQIYKYMDIGTAKPTLEERDIAPHHFIDIINPDDYYNAGIFGRQARKKVTEIFDRGKLPLVVGGAGFYIRALVEGFFELEIHDENVKESLRIEAREHGLESLYARLAEIDSAMAKRLHPNDSQRIMRALEVYEISGTPLSHLQSRESVACDFSPFYIGLTMDRAKLYTRIEKRVDAMLANGLIDEVICLKSMNYDESLPGLQTVGYKEVFQHVNEGLGLEDMIDLIKKNTRNYAKRQMTWFRKNRNIRWFDVSEENINCKIKTYMDSIMLS